jgi:hypothetical protein
MDRAAIRGFLASMMVTIGGLGLAWPGHAAGPRVGEPAPPLEIARWLKGDSLAAFAPGSVYVIDIWAPWCGPCLGGMPHLSDLQDRLGSRGLVVIGLSSADEYGSTLEKAEHVVRTQGDAIRYRIAWDRDRASYQRWMARENVSGWPWAFIVDRAGRIAWIGHPERMDDALERVLAGTWDLDSARIAYRWRADGLDLASSYAADYKAARDADARTDFAALRSHDPALAAAYAPSYFKLLMRDARTEEAYTFARGAVDTLLRDRPDELTRIAATIIAPATPAAARDLDVALACATRADQAGTRPDPHVIATLARVHALRGEWPQAQDVQRRAVAAADSSEREEYQATLARYRARRP